MEKCYVCGYEKTRHGILNVMLNYRGVGLVWDVHRLFHDLRIDWKVVGAPKSEYHFTQILNCALSTRSGLRLMRSKYVVALSGRAPSYPSAVFDRPRI
jgi:hypothetical protein